MPKYAQYIGFYRFSAKKTQFLALSKAREGSLGTPKKCFQICMCSAKCYVFQANWGLNHLEFSGYNKIYLDFTHFGAFWAYLGAYLGAYLEASRDPRPIFPNLYM